MSHLIQTAAYWVVLSCIIFHFLGGNYGKAK